MLAGQLELQMFANLARLANDMNEAKRMVGGAMGNIEKAVGQAKAALGALGIGLSAGMFVSMIKGSIDAADHLNDLTKSTNLAVQTLAGLRLASKQSGGDLDGIAASINKLSINMGKDAERFAKLGVSAKDPLEAFKQLADVFVAIQDPQTRAAVMAEALGKSWASAAPLMAEGSKRIGEMVEKGAALSGMTQEMAEQSDIFNDHMEELKAAAGSVATVFLNPLLPRINDIAKAMAGAAAESGMLKAGLVGLGGLIVGAFSDQLLSRPEKIGKDLSRLRDMLDAELSAPKWLMWSDAQKEKHQQQIAAINEAMIALQRELEVIQSVEAAEKAKAGTQTDAQKKAAAAAAAAAAAFLDTKKAAKDASDGLMKTIRERIALEQAELDAGEKLTESQKLRVDLMARLAEILDKITPQQQAAIRAAIDQVAALKAENEERERLAKLLYEADERRVKAIDGLDKEALAIIDETQKMREQAAELTLSREALEAIRIARLNDAIASQERRLALVDETSAEAEGIRKVIAALEDQKVARGELITAQNLKTQMDEWKRFTDEIDRALTDALMRGFENGKDGGKAFVDSLKNTLKTAAFKIAVQAIVNPVMGQMGSALGMTGGGSGGGIGSLFSAGSSANSLFGGSSAYSAFALSETGASMGLSTAYIDALGIGEAVGGTALTGLGAALPWVGGALAVGSMLGLFDGGGDDPHNNPSINGYHFVLGKEGVNPGAHSFVGGATSGAGWWGENTALPADQQAAINARVASTFMQGQMLAALLGVDPSGIDSASVTSDRNGNPGAAGYPGYWSSIDQAFAALGDSIAVKIIPNLSEFQASGESLAQTAARLAQEFELTNRMATMLGKNAATAFGGSNLKARDALIQSLGGLSGASNVFDAYYKNYHSEAERLTDTKGSVAATLRAIGIATVPGTRDEFRKLVEGQDLASESGRTMYATLLSVADAFAGITDAADAAAKALGSDHVGRTRADYIFAHRTGQTEIGQVAKSVDAMRADMRAVNAALARAMNKTAKILDQWDGDGMPTVRTL